MRYLLLWLLLATQVAAANPMLHQDGTRLVDGNGRPVYLRGVALSAWMNWEGYLLGNGILTSNTQILDGLRDRVGAAETDAFQRRELDTIISADDFADIARLGFSAVRVPFNYRLLDKDLGWKHLDDAVHWGTEHHLYVILDLHCAPGGQSRTPCADPPKEGTMWTHPAERLRTIELWQRIAKRYRDNPMVAYDVLNEPIAPRDDLLQLYRDLGAAIRAVDKQHLIIFEGNKMASDFSGMETPPCDNAAYSLHIYTWFGDNRKKFLATAHAAAARAQVPMWVGEFGENTPEMIASTVRMFEDPQYGISGWSYWPWKRARSRYPGLVILTPGPDWMTVIDWIVHPRLHRAPSPEVVRRGMQQFLTACQLSHCSMTQAILNALLPTR